MALRRYQEQALHDVGEHFNAGVRSVCLVVPTGGGKSVLATSWLTGDSLIKGAPRRHRDTGLFLVHRAQLRQQAFEHLERVLPGDVGMIGPGANPNPDGRVQVATIQTLRARGDRPDVKRVVADECFPAGTMIGDVRIEDLRTGDLVPSFDERTGHLTQAKVVGVMRRITSELLRVTAGRNSVVCTPNHPFLVMGKGWIPAANLTKDDYVASAARSGLEKGRIPDWSRVDRVEVLEPRSPRRPGEVPTDCVVYNLHVERTHTYVANGFVVHNCHHLAPGNDWTELLSLYPDAKILGLTATPERKDGRALGDIFEALVVGARYPELVGDGHLVPCRAFAPPEAVDRGIANDPVTMYQRYGEGGSGFLFADSIANAELWAERFSEAGIPAVAVHQNTPARDRARIMDAFAGGLIRILCNVYLFTEGTDIPAARVCILARPMTHASMYLQAVGRVLRPAPGKRDAILIDLCGSVLEHGLPTEDRTYSLDGRAIRRTVASVRQCPQCGAVHEGSPSTCDLCSYVWPPPSETVVPPPRIYDIELREVYAGAATPDSAKQREFGRLVGVATDRDYSLGWVVKQYARLFHEPPTALLAALDEPTKRREYDKLAALGRERGYKQGFPAARYRELFGTWPPRAWSRPQQPSRPQFLAWLRDGEPSDLRDIVRSCDRDGCLRQRLNTADRNVSEAEVLLDHLRDDHGTDERLARVVYAAIEKYKATFMPAPAPDFAATGTDNDVPF